MEKPNCYGECPVQQWLYDSHERLEETIRRRLISEDPHVRLNPDGADQLRLEQKHLRETSAAAAGTCRGLVANYVLYRGVGDEAEAVPVGKYCEAAVPANLKAIFGRPRPELPDNR